MRSIPGDLSGRGAYAAVYVELEEGGGQVNYLKDFGEQWWFRWQQTMAKGFAPEDFCRSMADSALRTSCCRRPIDWRVSRRLRTQKCVVYGVEVMSMASAACSRRS